MIRISLGGTNFMEGNIVKSLVTYKNQYYRLISSPKSKKVWSDLVSIFILHFLQWFWKTQSVFIHPTVEGYLGYNYCTMLKYDIELHMALVLKVLPKDRG